MKTLLKLITFPVAVVIDVFTWICCGLLSCSAFLFSIGSSLLGVLAVIVMLTGSLMNGLILLVIAFLVSPMGLPMLATWILSGLQNLSLSIKRL